MKLTDDRLGDLDCTDETVATERGQRKRKIGPCRRAIE